MAATEPAPSEQPPVVPRTAADIEREQEAILMKKYGGMAKKKLLPKDHKFFDSADWALQKQGVKTDSAAAAIGPPPTALPPKLEPTFIKPRRSSHLGEGEEEG